MPYKNYIYEYYAKITSGEIVAGKWIKQIYKILVDGLEKQEFFYNAKKANKAIKFIENFCHHSKVRSDLLKLELWQKAIVCAMFGIVDDQNIRIFREIFIVIGRKNGKSLFASAIIAYMAYLEPEYGQEIYCLAPKLDQAALVYDAFYKMVEAEDELKELAKKDDRVIYLSLSRNFGKESAMYAGFCNAKGDYITTMDADMQDPPSMIKTMYESIKNEGYDCVALCSPKHGDYSPLRKFFTNCWYKLIGKISSTPQVPGARDFRLMKRKVVDSIISMQEYNRYSKGIFSFVGFNTKWIEYETPERVAGNSKFNFWKLFKYALEGILAFSTTPLVISAFVGLIFCLIAFVAVIVIIVKTLAFGDPVGGWPSLACIIMFVSGIQLLFLGVIGMYLSKLYLEVKKRPVYIIDETEKMRENYDK